MKLHRFPLTPALLGAGFLTVSLLAVFSLTSLPPAPRPASPMEDPHPPAPTAMTPSGIASIREAPIGDDMSIEPETTSPDDLESERDTVRAQMSTLLAKATQLRREFSIDDNDPDFPTVDALPPAYTDSNEPVLVRNDGTIESFDRFVSSSGTTGNSGTTAVNGGTLNFTGASRELMATGNTLVLTNGPANNIWGSQVLTNGISGSVTTLSGVNTAQDQSVGDRVQLLTAYFNTAAPDPVRGLQDYQSAKSDYLAAREQLAALEHRLQVSHLNPLPPERVKDWRRLPALEAPSTMH